MPGEPRMSEVAYVVKAKIKMTTRITTVWI